LVKNGCLNWKPKKSKKKFNPQKCQKQDYVFNCGITTITKSKDENSRPLFNGTTTSNLQFSLEKQHYRLLQGQFAIAKQFSTTEIKTFRVA
jgi:hypothetical protein